MKGRLTKTEKGWMVLCLGHPGNVLAGKEALINYLPLHPDDVRQIEKDSLVFDNIEARIAAQPIIDFQIVTLYVEPPESIHCNRGGDISYAKIIPITLSDNFQIGAYEHKEVVEDHIDKLQQEAWDNYEHEEGNLYSTTFRNAFKLGYNKAKETLFTEEQVRLAIFKAAEIGFNFEKGTLNGLNMNLIEGQAYDIIQSLKQSKL